MKLTRPFLLFAAIVTGCAQGGQASHPGAPATTDGDGRCMDSDGDGHGKGCQAGPDCNDTDPSVQSGCIHCATPEQGCACEIGSAPTSCYLNKTEAEDGTALCQEGTRYCRDGQWSGCEDIHTYPLPEGNPLSTLINADAGPVKCSDCNAKCFIIRDNLDPVDGGLTNVGNGTDWAAGGGITLSYQDAGFIDPDAGLPVVDGGTISGPLDCIPGSAPDSDCDGIVDQYDPYPFQRPFATLNPAIFLDLAPGETGTAGIDLVFFMNSVDVYLLLDQTGSMQSVRQRLASALTNGSFLDPATECADTDLDGLPNSELLDQGVLGGMKCLFRNANFGVGYFRELPFDPYGNPDETTYRHMLDITDDVGAALAAASSLTVQMDIDWPDAAPLALYSIATGEGLYMGLDKPGVPPRSGCPAGRWGYPCFRADAIPVVILFTDSPMHEGPPVPGKDLRYDPANLTITAGTELAYVAVPPENDNLATAFPLGDVTDSYTSYAGDTRGLSSDYGNAFLSCVPSGKDASPDATFSFEVTRDSTVNFSTLGTTFASAVGVYNRVVDSPAEFASDDKNEVSQSALDLVNVADDWALVSGDTSTMSADYTVADLTCGGDDAGADAVFKFSLSHGAVVGLDTSGSSFDTVLSLFDRAPALRTPLLSDNTNDDIGLAQVVGDVYQRIYSVSGGDTSAATLSASFSETEIGCSAHDLAADAVYRFELSQPTRVRLDTQGSSFDTVIGLADGQLGGQTAIGGISGNELQASAYDVGEALGAWYLLQGTTGAHDADYRAGFIGCSADTQAPETVFKLSLSEATRMRFDTSGSAFDTVISLHDGEIDPTTPVTTDNGNDRAGSATALGTVDTSWFEVFGGDTTTMTADYASEVIGCGADDLAHDAVFSFQVGTLSKVRIDTAASSFDTVVSLHDAPPPLDTIGSIPAATEFFDLGGVSDQSKVFTGSTAGLSAEVGGESLGCETAEDPPDMMFQFTVDSGTEVEISTEGSSFDTVIALFGDTVAAPTKPTPTTLDNLNELKLSAHDLGALDDSWAVVTGDTSGMADDFPDFGCSAMANANDAVVAFSLASERTVEITTAGSSFDTVIGLFDATNDALLLCDQDSGPLETSTLTRTLAAGSYYVVVKGDRSPDNGAYTLSLRDISIANPITCNDNAFVTGESRLVVQLLPGTYHLALKGAATGQAGDFRIRFRDRDYFTDHRRLACDDSSGGGFTSRIERELAAGTYYVVVKGDLPADNGPFKLTVRSTSNPQASSHLLACDNDSGTATASRLEADLAAGDYWVVVKGTAAQSGLYDLEVRDIGVSGQGIVLACDNDSGGDHSVIERDLLPGIYYAFVKGDNPADEGSYVLNLSDASNTGGTPLRCNDDSAALAMSGPSYIEQSLGPGDYWAVLKGKTGSDAGAYSLSVRDLGTASRTTYACSDADTFSVDLEAGLYDVVLKGVPDGQSGTYTLTVGNGQTQTATFQPPDWETTLNALRDTETRVITVLNCHDNGLHGDGRDCDDAHRQAETLANATDAVSAALQPLVVDIDSNGTGIETAIMDQLLLLSGNLDMNISIRVVFEPDANPGFLLALDAIDKPGDGCNGLVGLEHQNCTPGATPSFSVSFTNPLDAPVPLNPNDPLGGYSFRADLIADGQFVIDSIPIYIIPEDVDDSTPPPEPLFVPTGTYHQDLQAPGCVGNERPDWQDLFWSADLPLGTVVRFNVCAAEIESDLNTCTMAEAAEIKSTGPCSTDADCSQGFCAANGTCTEILSGSCTMDAECWSGSFCDMTVGQCRYANQPVYVGDILQGTNYYTYLRVQVQLEANPTTNESPTVYDWGITYFCSNVN
ncbi:MAG: hypothetical protein OEZ06_11940 [Myxococcales bacterium]|nr:hypothetical protein [Myxococcales bacterium]